MKRYVLEIPCTPPSINAYQHWHWARKRQVKREWEEWVWALTRLHVKLRDKRHVRVRSAIYFRRGGRRDPHNYAATLYKFLDDGLVAAGVIPDDTAEYISHEEPRLLVGKTPRTVIELEVV